MASAVPLVEITRSGRVATLTISRPDKLNAINQQMADELASAWRQCEAADDVRAVILQSVGDRAFTAGADIHDPPSTYDFLPGVGTPMTKPLIVVVQGMCVGVGVVIVQLADLCVAATGARFQYPEGRLGVGQGLVAGMTQRIAHKVAMELMLTGRWMSAERLWQAGLLNEVTERGDEREIAAGLASAVVEQSPEMLSMMKDFVSQTMAGSPGEDALRVLHRINRTANNRPWQRPNTSGIVQRAAGT